MADQAQHHQYQPPQHVFLPSRIPDEFVQTQHDNLAYYTTLWPNGSAGLMEFPGNLTHALAGPAASASYMSTWEAVIAAILMILVALSAILGNILVVVSVFTYPPLKNCQNYLIASLAVADVLLSVLVMPFQMVYAVAGEWRFGLAFCIFSLTMDVCLCTASILNLVGIALDRYWAIHDPINYSQKRTAKRVLAMIAIIWVMSFIISSPPLFGWNDWNKMEASVCVYTQELGYIVYSSFGSFFIPLIMLLTIYFRIFLATRRRLRKRAQANKMLMQQANHPATHVVVRSQNENNNNNITKLDSSEDNHDEDSPSCVVYTGTNNDNTTSLSAENMAALASSSSSRQGSLRLRQQQQQQHTMQLLAPSQQHNNNMKLLSSADVGKKVATENNNNNMVLNANNDVDDDEESVVLPKNVNIKQSTRDLLKKSCAEIAASRPPTPPAAAKPPHSMHHFSSTTTTPDTNVQQQQHYQTTRQQSNDALNVHESSSMLLSTTTTTSSSVGEQSIVGNNSNNNQKSNGTIGGGANKQHKQPLPASTAANRLGAPSATKNGGLIVNTKISTSLYNSNAMTPPTPRLLKRADSMLSMMPPMETPPVHPNNTPMRRTAGGTMTTSAHDNSSNLFVANALKEKQKISLTKERKAARTLLMIVAGFTACWLPFFLAYVIVPFCPQCGEPPPRLWMFVLWLGYCNSAINPFIYTTSVDFRRGFARVLSRYFGGICPCFKKLDDGSHRR